MNIHQIYTYNELRNFTYVLELADETAIVIDPWDSEEINKKLNALNLKLKAIINTHEHWDHTQGNEALVSLHGCEVWAHTNGKDKIPGLSRCLVGGELIDLGGNSQIQVVDTPGHTFAHLCFIVKEDQIERAIFTGDTLFNAGVGHCRLGGEEDVLYDTISQKFQHLADNIKVYPGHDYLENNLRFTLNLEPHNQIAKNWLTKVVSADYVPGSIQTTIADEKSFNTFLRLDNEDIIANLALDKPDAKTVFIALRKLRDNW